MKKAVHILFFIGTYLFLLSNWGCNKPEEVKIYVPPTYLSCYSFEENLILKNNSNAPIDYKIDCWIKVKHNLTIEPGTVIQFEFGAGLKITNGTILCNGTSENRIILKSARNLPGEWIGIVIDRNNNNPNSIHFTDIIDAGGTPEYSEDELGSIVLLDSSTLSLHNCTIKNGMQTGVNMSYEEIKLSNSHNTISNCLQPIRILFSEITQLSNSNTFNNNHFNYIEVGANFVAGKKVAMLNHGIPYYFSNYNYNFYTNDVIYKIKNSGGLVISPGVTIYFARDVLLFASGTILANGTSSNPIKFLGFEPQKGYWLGISMSSARESFLNNVTIKDAGYSSILTSWYKTACAIYLSHGAELKLTNSSISGVNGNCAILRGTSYGSDNFTESNNNYNGLDLCKF